MLSDPVAPVEMFLSQVLLPTNPEDTPDDAARRLALAEEIGAGAEGCDALRRLGADIEESLSGDLGWVNLRDMPNPFRNAVAELEVGRPTPPLVTDNGVHVVMVCERRTGDAELGVRDSVYDRIARARLAIVERRLLRDLRRRAFVDVRV